MEDGEFLEEETRVFAGKVVDWRSDRAKLVTDSGITVVLATKGLQAVPAGTHVTVVTRKFLPVYRAIRVVSK